MNFIKRSAFFDGDYRYLLRREWDANKGKLVFIMLNPSLADDKEEDPTTRRCIYFAKKFGYGSLEIVNLFARITPYPRDLRALNKKDAIGSKNDDYLVSALNSANKIIAAWGENGKIHKRNKEIVEIINGYEINSVGTLTRDGHPRHPLFLSNNVELVPYIGPEKKKLSKANSQCCESCQKSFPLNSIQLCNSCFEDQLIDFKEFILQKYRLNEKSAKDYSHRFKGIINRGLYNGHKELTPSLRASIEKEFPNSKNHYVLTVKRYMEYLIWRNNR